MKTVSASTRSCSARWVTLVALFLAGAIDEAYAASAYPGMAPLGDYLMADRSAEVALARSAAPPSVSADAEVLVLGSKGYFAAAPGKNAFVCLVQRAWFSGVEDKDFWNPRVRAPICYNRQGARSVLPIFLTRTIWALSGASQAEIRKRTRAALAAGQLPAPEVGTISFMMSKGGYLGDAPRGPWHPHLMFYMPPMPTADWGADLPGTRVLGAEAGVDPWTMFFVPVATWSDGSPDENAAMRHGM